MSQKDAACPTRILHITFNMGFGGTEQVIRQLVTNLDSARFQCEIACIDGEVGAIGQTLEAEHGIKIHARQRAPGLDFRTILWLRRLIKTGGFDIVHCHQYSPYTYGWFAHWCTAARVIFTEHGRFHPDQHRKKARFINPIIARTSSSLVAISKATRDALVEYEYLPRNRIDVIYNGIAPLTVDPAHRETLRQELGLNPDETVIGTVARLDAVKNQAMMIRATRALRDQNHKVRLLLVGDGPEREALQTLVEDMELEASVMFTGFQSQPADYLSLINVFLLPSFTEGTSMTLLEAMSLGIPTVATRVGGTPEIVADGETGILTESDNLSEFTSALKRLFEQPATREQMAENAKQRFSERFSVAQMVEQYQRLYEITPRNTLEAGLKPRPPSLSSAEVAIFKAGGARGLSGGNDLEDVVRREMSVIEFDLEYRKVIEQSLDGNQVAERLRVSPSRVRQLALPANPGLYSFLGRTDKRLFSMWQFDEGAVIPHLRELLKALSQELHPVTVHRFMTTEHQDLEAPELDHCLSPRDWLITGHKPEAVMMLARDL